MFLLILRFILLMFLILCVGFFTSSETAYLSLPKLKLRAMLDEKKKHAKTVAYLKNNMDRLLTIVLIGTNFLNSLTSALATAMVIEITSGRYVALTPFVTAFFITTFGQIIPKTIAGLYPEKVTGFSSVPLLVMGKIFFPIVWLFERLSHIVVFIVEKISKPVENGITEEELKALIDVGQNEGTIEKDESRMMNKIIRFNDLLVSDIMKHRSFVRMVNQDATHDEVVEEFLKSGVSTLVVYKETKENVVGVINYKKILYGENQKEEDLSDSGIGYAGHVMSDVLYVPGTLSVLEILNKFRNSQYKFAVVLNEQGETSGIVTIEDVLRTVFGHMHDEEQRDDVPAEDKIKLISSNTFLVPGDLKLEEVNEILGLQLNSDNVNTLGGFVLEKFGFLPSIGEVVIVDKSLFFVEDIFQRRIVSVKIKINKR